MSNVLVTVLCCEAMSWWCCVSEWWWKILNLQVLISAAQLHPFTSTLYWTDYITFKHLAGTVTPPGCVLLSGVLRPHLHTHTPTYLHTYTPSHQEHLPRGITFPSTPLASHKGLQRSTQTHSMFPKIAFITCCLTQVEVCNSIRLAILWKGFLFI